ncbi:hypothetical protein LEN26_007311 [Aphanomyces euteiches]|nr:hypothetical protein AeMF1_009298 [Aphanomyces euteiches]KAH9132696.1 hypothetical protein LEN26_007311 [Aphanomyces euteiches]KAH9196363.1 hypothetical protein AeNC1_001658 [Aphanomyces euteiches]
MTDVSSDENAERKCDRRLTIDGVVLTQNFFCAAENATGGALWDSSLVLWERIRRREFASKRILELGSGVGFLAIKLANAGAHVIATDGDNDAMHLLRDNLKRNNVNDAVKSVPLEWYALDFVGRSTNAFPRGDEAASTQLLSTHGPSFDYVVGADLIYNSDIHEPLLTTLRAVCSTTTTFLFSYRVRHEDKEQRFLERLQEHFDVVELHPVEGTGIVYVELKKK